MYLVPGGVLSPRGVYLVSGGVLSPRGHGFIGGMVFWGAWFSQGAWFFGGVFGGGMVFSGFFGCIGYNEIRYASYWNAFLFSLIFCRLHIAVV